MYFEGHRFRAETCLCSGWTLVLSRGHALAAKDIEVRSVECTSHQMSKFKSFKLTVSQLQMSTILSESLLPMGVKVKRYIPPRYNPLSSIGDTWN